MPGRSVVDAAEVARLAAQDASAAAVLRRDHRQAKPSRPAQLAPVQVSGTGLPPYRRAEPMQDQSSRLTSGRGVDVTATKLTRDSLSAVAAFYAPILEGKDLSGKDAQRQVTVLSNGATGLDVRIVDLQDRAVQRIRPAPAGGQVVIQLSRAPGQ